MKSLFHIDFSNKDGRFLLKDILSVTIIGLVFASMAIVMKNGGVSYLQHLRHCLITQTNGNGWLDTFKQIALFILTGSILITMGIPRLWVSAAAGAAFGAVPGTVWALAASLIGSCNIYWIGRTVLGQILYRRVSGKFLIWKTRFFENAFWWVLYGRLFPLSNATLFSLICGSCQVKFIDYVLASLFGFIPLTLIFAVFGNGGFHGNTFQIALGFFLLVIVVIFRKLLMKTHIGKQLLVSVQNGDGTH